MDLGKLIDDIERQASSNGDINYLHFNTWMNFINKVGSVVLSIIIALIVILLPIIIALEVFYISFPLFRVEVVEKKIFKGDGKVKRAVQITLHDAIKAIELANTVKTGTPALKIYMGIKFKWVLLVAMSLTVYLGGIDIIISLALELLSGLLNVVKNTIF